jgi:hypothetical protein
MTRCLAILLICLGLHTALAPSASAGEQDPWEDIRLLVGDWVGSAQRKNAAHRSMDGVQR